MKSLLVAIRSVLFSAGRGRRLRPLSDSVPKPAVPILDIPLAAWALDRLIRVRPPVLVNLSHLPEVAARLLLGPFGDLDQVETMVESPEPYGTAGTLKALAARIGPRVLVCNGDLLSNLEPTALLATHRALGTRATAAFKPVRRQADVELIASSPLAGAFIDRRRRNDASGGQFIGMAVFERDVLELIPDQRPSGLGETVLRRLADEGALGVHPHTDYALDVGTIDRYLRASLDVLEGKGPPPLLDPPGKIKEVEGGHAYVGPNVAAPEGAAGPGAILLSGCKLGAGARVERAVVWPGERVPEGEVVRESIWAFGTAIHPHSMHRHSNKTQ